MGCQSTLLRLVEDWRRALDNDKYVSAILMNLSKTFDCLLHDLLLGKVRAYGLTEKASSSSVAISVTGNSRSNLARTVATGHVS